MNDFTTPAPLAPAPTVTPQVERHPKASVSTSEAVTMAGWIKADLTSGKMTQAQADRAFAELNTPPEQRGPDTRSEEAKELDRHFPTAKESDYTIRYGRPGEDVKETPELKQFDASARTWMATAGMPKEIGNRLVNAIAKVTATTQHMSADQLETYGHAEFEKLQRAHGPALEERLRDASRMVHELETQHPGLKNLLNSRGIGDSAMVANLLMGHAKIYHARKGC